MNRPRPRRLLNALLSACAEDRLNATEAGLFIGEQHPNNWRCEGFLRSASPSHLSETPLSTCLAGVAPKTRRAREHVEQMLGYRK